MGQSWRLRSLMLADLAYFFIFLQNTTFVCVFDNKLQMQIKKLFFKVKIGACFAAP